MSDADGATPRLHPDVVWRRVGDEAVLVNLKTNRIYSLNVTGARFWELLSDGLDGDAAQAVLREEFDVDEEELRGEVAALTAQLARDGLLA